MLLARLRPRAVATYVFLVVRARVRVKVRVGNTYGRGGSFGLTWNVSCFVMKWRGPLTQIRLNFARSFLVLQY